MQASQPIKGRKSVQFTVQIPGQIWVQINTSSLIARAIRSYMQLISTVVKMSSNRLDGPIGNTYEFAITAIVPFLPPGGVYKRPLSRYLNRFQGQKQSLAVLAQL